MDKHNPETGNPIAHAIQDAHGYTLGALAIGAAILSG